VAEGLVCYLCGERTVSLASFPWHFKSCVRVTVIAVNSSISHGKARGVNGKISGPLDGTAITVTSKNKKKKAHALKLHAGICFSSSRHPTAFECALNALERRCRFDGACLATGMLVLCVRCLLILLMCSSSSHQAWQLAELPKPPAQRLPLPSLPSDVRLPRPRPLNPRKALAPSTLAAAAAAAVASVASATSGSASGPASPLSFAEEVALWEAEATAYV
jgi:hypothetical protein